MSARATLHPTTAGTTLSYFAPPADLVDYFGAQYLFNCDLPAIKEHTRADFAQIRFMLSGTGHYRFADENEVETPAVCLIGPTNMVTDFVAQGPMLVFGVSVLPLGWAALGLGDASAVADDALDLSAALGPDCLALLARLCAARDVNQSSTLLWDFLRAKLRPVSGSDRTFVDATNAWLADTRSPRIAALQTATGLGARQLARLCNRLYGAPPKHLARKYRALRCALELARDERPWTELAGDDFYDQSHFIREIRHFTGLTPTDLLEKSDIVLRLTMTRRAVEGDLAPLSRMS